MFTYSYLVRNPFINRNLPHIAALILARSGSKGIPLKNLSKVGGRTILSRSIREILKVGHLTSFWVSTDHSLIFQEAANSWVLSSSVVVIWNTLYIPRWCKQHPLAVRWISNWSSFISISCPGISNKASGSRFCCFSSMHISVSQSRISSNSTRVAKRY